MENVKMEVPVFRAEMSGFIMQLSVSKVAFPATLCKNAIGCQPLPQTGVCVSESMALWVVPDSKTDWFPSLILVAHTRSP